MINRDRETGALVVTEWSTIQIEPQSLIGLGLFYFDKFVKSSLQIVNSIVQCSCNKERGNHNDQANNRG